MCSFFVVVVVAKRNKIHKIYRKTREEKKMKFKTDVNKNTASVKMVEQPTNFTNKWNEESERKKNELIQAICDVR